MSSRGTLGMDRTHPLFGCRLKLDRAQDHADALQDGMDAFLERKPYEATQEFDAESKHFVARIRVRENPPLEWSPLMGDFIHNMRSALDHLAWQLVLRNGRQPTGGNLFPIFTKDPLNSDAYPSPGEHKTARKRWKDRIKGMHPGDVALLQTFQPYGRTELPETHPLARLNQLSNWDKHREMHFTGQTGMGNVVYVKPTTRDAKVRPVYLKPPGEMFEDGAEAARFECFVAGPNPKVDLQLLQLFDIAFGKGSPMEGLGVKRVLIDIGRCVWDVILTFRDRFDNDDFSFPSREESSTA